LEVGENKVAMSDESRLIGELMNRYKTIGKHTRPVFNSSMPVEVRLSIILRQIIHVDENKQYITLKLLLHMVQCIIITRIVRYADAFRRSRRRDCVRVYVCLRSKGKTA